MLQFDNFKAWISVDGIALPHYGIQTDASPPHTTVTCWIPSEAGKAFAVNWSNDVGSPVDISGYIRVDGTKCGGLLTKAGRRLPSKMADVYTSPTSKSSLMFSSLELTDDDAYLNAASSKDLGTIVLDITQVIIRGPTTVKTVRSADQKVHERSKKAMAHRVKFGAATPCAPSSARHTERVRTIVTFIFKYRSIELLKATDIIPADPHESTTGEKRKTLEDPNANEDDEDEKELKALQEKISMIQAKRERKGVQKKVKTEIRPVIISGEIIDLT